MDKPDTLENSTQDKEWRQRSKTNTQKAEKITSFIESLLLKEENAFLGSFNLILYQMFSISSVRSTAFALFGLTKTMSSIPLLF